MTTFRNLLLLIFAAGLLAVGIGILAEVHRVEMAFTGIVAKADAVVAKVDTDAAMLHADVSAVGSKIDRVVDHVDKAVGQVDASLGTAVGNLTSPLPAAASASSLSSFFKQSTPSPAPIPKHP